uniref:lysozyme n=1 Tax=Kryptolebias marmoratus TaxID=37003 RepID=A0A3Q3F596_KRYMA
MKILVLLLLVAVADGRVFERCDWARTLKSYGMDGYRGISLANWVCLTRAESSFNTEAVNLNLNTDGSLDYGIFQINSRWWCDNGRTRTANGCNIKCSELLSDDVGVAIDCAKRIVRDPQGISAWVSWTLHCKNKDLTHYLKGCPSDVTTHLDL